MEAFFWLERLLKIRSCARSPSRGSGAFHLRYPSIGCQQPPARVAEGRLPVPELGKDAEKFFKALADFGGQITIEQFLNGLHSPNWRV